VTPLVTRTWVANRIPLTGVPWTLRSSVVPRRRGQRRRGCVSLGLLIWATENDGSVRRNHDRDTSGFSDPEAFVIRPECWQRDRTAGHRCTGSLAHTVARRPPDRVRRSRTRLDREERVSVAGRFLPLPLRFLVVPWPTLHVGERRTGVTVTKRKGRS
jgi:hypothetical protein